MFKTLDDYKKNDKQDKKKADSYAGGEKSGLAVEHPDDIEGIIQKARQGGQEHKDQGRTGPPKTEIKITLYSNGFVVDDQPFRDYNTPENQQFMKELNEGYVPKEIQGKYKGGVSVGLEDRRKEAYRPPTPPKYVAYSGTGQSIGGVQGVGLEVNVNAAEGRPKVNENEPTTTIQIRFHNGQTASLVLNLTSKVGEIHEFVMVAAPVDGEYQLISGFPPKPIADPSKTIAEAGLKSAKITQKIV